MLVFLQKGGHVGAAAPVAQPLQGADGEGAGAGKGVYAADVGRGEALGLAKVALQDVVHAADDEVHALHGRVDDAELLGGLGEGVFEELLIERPDHVLLLAEVVKRPAHLAHVVAEVVQHTAVVHEGLALQQLHHVAHGEAHGVVVLHVVVGKEGVKHGPRHEVLGEECYGLVCAYRAVHALPQLADQQVHLVAVLPVAYQLCYAGNEVVRHPAHPLAPVGPVEAVAHLLHHAGVELVVKVKLQLADVEFATARA